MVATSINSLKKNREVLSQLLLYLPLLRNIKVPSDVQTDSLPRQQSNGIVRRSAPHPITLPVPRPYLPWMFTIAYLLFISAHHILSSFVSRIHYLRRPPTLLGIIVIFVLVFVLPLTRLRHWRIVDSIIENIIERRLDSGERRINIDI
jgi:hypothetical protein